MEKSNKIGVIIARFQVPDLHEGHLYFINEVYKRHHRVLFLLGVAPIKLSENNPLNFETRKLMLEKELHSYEYWRSVSETILPLYDMKKSDEQWSDQVDKIIQDEFFVNKDGAILYGSRDSFIPHYHGMFKTQEIEMKVDVSGRDLREEATKIILPSSDFRKGIIYATSDKFPLIYSCVDVAILNDKEDQILLGRKMTDPEDEWRFIGGFMDFDDDNDFAAARREAYEETRVEIEPYELICSVKVNDWRYRSEKNSKIMTRLIKARHISGVPKAGDDISEVAWFDINGRINLVEEHRHLYDKLIENLSKNKSYERSTH